MKSRLPPPRAAQSRGSGGAPSSGSQKKKKKRFSWHSHGKTAAFWIRTKTAILQPKHLKVPLFAFVYSSVKQLPDCVGDATRGAQPRRDPALRTTRTRPFGGRQQGDRSLRFPPEWLIRKLRAWFSSSCCLQREEDGVRTASAQPPGARAAP